MKGLLTLAALEQAAAAGEIDTVIVCGVDMQGRLMGKRFHVEHFLESHDETHCCQYLLATDLNMITVSGYRNTGWERGYGDYVLKPDLSTLRRAAWAPGAAMVLCDILDHHTHEAVPASPRAILRRQIERLAAHGLAPRMATELEFFLFKEGYDDLRRAGYRPLETIGAVNEDYHILQGAKEEHILRPLRNTLRASGIPVEGTKGEAETGQQELNVRWAEGMPAADHHTIAKHATKEIAYGAGHSASFMAKWRPDKTGSATHIHLSLANAATGESAFYQLSQPHGMSETMRRFLAGMLKYAPDITVFLAPYVNSYKRFARASFAPTRIVWSMDNRTAGFRLVGEGTKGLRIECRIGGADLNAYLAMAALIAAGLAGVEEKLELGPPMEGDAYAGEGSHVPRTLRDAMAMLKASTMLRAAMGDEVVEHYHRMAEWEQEDFDRAVTDYEIQRGFEMC